MQGSLKAIKSLEQHHCLNDFYAGSQVEKERLLSPVILFTAMIIGFIIFGSIELTWVLVFMMAMLFVLLSGIPSRWIFLGDRLDNSLLLPWALHDRWLYGRILGSL